MSTFNNASDAGMTDVGAGKRIGREELERSKRLRRDYETPHGEADDEKQKKTDCYDDVLNGEFGLTCDGEDGLLLLDDWFTVSTNGKCPDSSAQSTESSKIDTEQLKLAIEQTSQQLTRVKRLLWPAAEECANAVEKVAGKSRTTASTEFVRARSLANPMEALGESRTDKGLNHRLFINRSAIKMANIDRQIDLLPRSIWWNEPVCYGSLGCGRDSIPSLIFADLCSAPGGFSEYFIRRFLSYIDTAKLPPSAICRGYGMSLLGTNEHGSGLKWKVGNIQQLNVRYEICNGSDGTGDIYNWENVVNFQKLIAQDINTTAVHAGVNLHGVQLVVADGGFDQQRDHECQEQIAQKLVLCEMAAALELLCCGGTFVVKMFGFQTSAIRLAMKSLSERFEDGWVCLKPVSSRPASSERYVVFQKYVGRRDDWRGGTDWITSILMGTSLRYNRILIGPSSLQSSQVFSDFETELDHNDLKMLKLNLRACNTILGTLRRKTAILETHGSTGEREWETIEDEAQRIPIELYRRFFHLDRL